MTFIIFGYHRSLKLHLLIGQRVVLILHQEYHWICLLLTTITYYYERCWRRNVTIHQLIWSHRNKTRLQEQSLPLNSIREAVCKYLQRFNSCRDKPRTIKQIRRRRWQPPKPGEYKINFDGAMFSEEDEAGLGIVVWDSAGQVLASLAEKIKKPHSVECLEKIAARWAVIKQRKLDCSRPTLKVTQRLL